MKNLPLLLATIIGTFVFIAVVGFAFSRTDTSTPEVADVNVLMKGVRHTKGPDAAKVTVVEFSDFQCPACLSTEPLVSALLAKHGQEIKFVYRHLPLTAIHPLAQTAALASEAASDQGKFWEIHQELFATQEQWTKLKSEAEFKQFLDQIITKLSIDKNSFTKTMDESSVRDRVTEDVVTATQLSVNSTPTFFVNGRVTPAPDLMTAVESALAGNQ